MWTELYFVVGNKFECSSRNRVKHKKIQENCSFYMFLSGLK